MELWDIYDKDRNKTGQTHVRGEKLKQGEYHLVVHVWIMNEVGEFLIQKRQPWKDPFPNLWDCAVAGSATAGDDSGMAAIREAKEELGIDINMDNAEMLFTLPFRNGFDDIWFVRQNVKLEEIVLQEEEVAEVRFATVEEIREMIQEGKFIDFDYVEKVFIHASSYHMDR